MSAALEKLHQAQHLLAEALALLEARTPAGDLARRRYAGRTTFARQLRAAASSRALSAASVAHLSQIPVARIHELWSGAGPEASADEREALAAVLPDLQA